jgi:hypothetical protein
MKEKELRVKETVRVTVSDPNPRDRRARWIRDKLSSKNVLRQQPTIGNGDGHQMKTDSGFQELSESLPKFYSTNDDSSVFG